MTGQDPAGRTTRESDRSSDGGGPRSIAGWATGRRTILAAAVLAVSGLAATIAGLGREPVRRLLGAGPPRSAPLDLLPHAEATHRAVRSGAWDDPAVWAGGAVPGSGARVLVESGVAVTVAREEPARLGVVRVDGTLRFDPTVDTRLDVDTLLTSPGSTLTIGTQNTPVSRDVTARITFVDRGPIDEDRDPERLSRGLIAMGELAVHGAEKTPWTTLASAPGAGDASIALPAPPTNWRPGDRIVVPGVVPDENQDERRTVASVDGSTVRLDSALQYDHVPPEPDLDAYALNTSRNVVFASEARDVDRRGHVLLTSAGTDVRYAEFFELGRTDKSRVFTDPQRGVVPDDAETNPRARYPFHYHVTGIDAEPHVAEGLVVEGSPGWGIVNHHGHARVTDSVTYRVFGSGFVAEAGNERGSFERNFALRSGGSGETIDTRNFLGNGEEGRVDDFGHGGHGFWLQGPMVEVVDNVAAGHRHYGFVFWNRPLIDWTMQDDGAVADRVGTVPNLPLQHVDGQRPLKDAIEAGRDAPGEYADYDGTALGVRSTERMVSSAFVPIQRFEGNEAFAAGGGLDVSRHQFRWTHHRYDEYGVVDDFTVWGIGPLVTDDGEVRGAIKGGTKPGGNQAASFRYSANLAIRNSRFVGGDVTGVGVGRHDYLFTTVVEDSTIEGWAHGVVSGEHDLTLVRGNTLDNDVDVDWLVGNTGPLVVEDNDFGPVRTADVDHALSYADVKAGELLAFERTRGVEIDGRTAYYEEQRPEYVPVESEEELVTVTTGSGYGHMAEVIGHDDPEVVVGMTNRELMERFGVAVGGGLLPEDAVEEAFVTGGLVEPADADGPARAAWLDATAGSVGDGFDVVSDPNAARGRCLRVNESGTASPPVDPATATSLSFDVARGTYTVHGRIWPESWNGDDLWLRLDGGEWLRWHKLKPPRGFEWHAAKPDNDGEELYEFDLDEGRHALEIGCANEGVMIDKLLVAADQTTAGWFGHPADDL